MLWLKQLTRLEKLKFFLKSNEADEIKKKDHLFNGFISDLKPSTEKLCLKIEDNRLYDDKKKVGIVLEISSSDDMKNIMDTTYEDLDYILIETGDWHIIPLENLIAKFNSLDIQLMAVAKNPQHIDLLENILEIGVGICVIETSQQFELDAFEEKITKKTHIIPLKEAVITHIEKIGIGDRVCVDTCSLLKEGEGLLVGSTAAVMGLVQAEVEETGFVNARPFRINAGVVASYMLFQEKTKYLSEIRAGSQVMIVNRMGETRSEYVARVKIERRPLILLRFIYEEKEYPMILQDAETVKLILKNGTKRVDKLEIGDKILVSQNNEGRHFGMSVNETIEER